MTPPDTHLAEMPAPAARPLRPERRPPWRERGRRLVLPMLLASLLLHLLFLLSVLWSNRVPTRPAVSPPSFEMRMEPSTKQSKPNETRPTEIPAPNEPPAPSAPRPVPPQPQPTPQPQRPPTPMPTPPPIPLSRPTLAPPRPVPPPPPMPLSRPTPPQTLAPQQPAAVPPSVQRPTPSPPAPQAAPRPPEPVVTSPSGEIAAPPPLAPPKPILAPPPPQSSALPPAVPLPKPPTPAPASPQWEEPQWVEPLPPKEARPAVQQPPPPLAPPRPRRPVFPMPMDTSLGPSSSPSHSHFASRGTGALDLRLGRAALDSNGAPPRDSNAETGSIRVRGAHVGKDWIELLHEWWLQHGYYPEEAQRRNEDGTVAIHVKVDRNGQVHLVELESTSGSQWLDMGAQATFRGAHLPPFPPSTPEPEADLDITIDYMLTGR